MKAFENALVYVEGEGLKKTNLAFGDKISSIGGDIAGAEVISLPDDAVVLPGFIDEHIHGAGGADELAAAIKRAMKNYLYKKTKQSPMIIPIVTEL